jgi:UDP-glucose 4-epimerase
MHILVTGGNGFLGRHLVDRLLKEGHEVTILDNFSSSQKQEMKGVQIIKGDIRDRSDVARAMKNCEAVFHLAALTNIRDGDETADYEVNFLGAKNVFGQATEQNAKIIFTSSAAVYGDTAVCKEDAACKPISQYGRSKLKAENFLRKDAPKSFIARPFNIYGPGGKSVINIFCRNMPAYRPVTIFGNGMQTRDYVYADDIVDALVMGLENSGTFNAGTGREASLLEILDIIHEITRAKPEYKFALPKQQEIKRSKADISKIRKELGWSPKTDLNSGILKTLADEGWKKEPSIK